jgi:hypothetical protein
LDDAFDRGPGDPDLGGGEIVVPESGDRVVVGVEVMAPAAASRGSAWES